MSTEFLLPELGENVAGGDVVRVMVKPGDAVERDQPVLELETDKATIEVPSSMSGVVREVRVKEGQKVKVGEIVFLLDAGDPPERKTEARPAETEPAEPEDEAALAASPEAEAAASTGVEADVELEGDVPVQAAAEQREAQPAAITGPLDVILPELGENVTGGDVVRVLVNVGDTIAHDQPLLELETDKATIEVPSPASGIVREVRVKPGDKAQVGQVVLVVDVAGAGPAAGAARGEAPGARAGSAPPDAGSAPGARGSAENDEWPARDAGERPAAAARVDYDSMVGGLEQRLPGKVRRGGPDKPGMHEDALREAEGETAARPRAEVVSFSRGARPAEPDAPRLPAPAAPSVRRVARELGVEIGQVPGSGPGGRISADDVKAYVKRVMASGGPKAAVAAPGITSAPAALPDFSKWGQVERKPMRAVRRKTAEHLSQAWAQIPHVTQHDKADITALEDLRKRYARQVEAGGGKLTVTAIALKVVAAALRVFPQFNASIDMAAGEIVEKKYVHVGVAVDTDRGLLVPVIRDVDRKNLVQIAAELAQLSEKARSGKATLEEMQGGSITITNLGGIGGTAFTPIVNHPEVAILGMSRGAIEPVWVDGEFKPRLMLPLSLSYDHRAIDGADAIRFLRWVCEALEQPFLLSLQG